ERDDEHAVSLELSDNVEPVAVGQAEVHDGDIGSPATCRLQGHLAVCGTRDVVPPVRQQLAHPGEVHGVVIRDEDTPLRHKSCGSLASAPSSRALLLYI